MSVDGTRHGPPEELPAYRLSVSPTSVLNATAKAEIVDLCTRAFNEDFGELFDLVAYAVAPMHVEARIDGILVAHAMWSERRLFLEDGSSLVAAYVDAVATDPTRQRRGLGSAVVERLMHETQRFALGCLSTSRTTFYARLGWERWTGPTAVKTPHGVEPTPDATVMIYRTERSPRIDTSGLLVVQARRSQPW